MEMYDNHMIIFFYPFHSLPYKNKNAQGLDIPLLYQIK